MEDARWGPSVPKINVSTYKDVPMRNVKGLKFNNHLPCMLLLAFSLLVHPCPRMHYIYREPRTPTCFSSWASQWPIPGNGLLGSLQSLCSTFHPSTCTYGHPHTPQPSLLRGCYQLAVPICLSVQDRRHSQESSLCWQVHY